MRDPTRKELLAEVARLTAQNERLRRLVDTRRPELEQLRFIEVGLRDYLSDWALERLREIHEQVAALLPENDDDLPTLTEMRGICSIGKRRVDAALAKVTPTDPPSAGATPEGKA